ncbi:hypothetical protein D3C73_1088580 [compost metagenome]
MPVRKVYQRRLDARQPDAVQPAFVELARDQFCRTAENVVGQIAGSRQAGPFTFSEQSGQRFRVLVTAQVHAQGMQVSHMPPHELGFYRVQVMGIVDEGKYLPAQAAGAVDHRAPQCPGLPPAIVRTGVAKADKHHQRGTQERQGHQGQLKPVACDQHGVQGDDHVPEQ